MKPKRQSVIKHVLGVERCYAKIILVLLPIFTLVAVSHAQEVKATTTEELGPNNVWSFKEDGLWEDIDKKCGGGGGFSGWRSSSKILGIDEKRVPVSFIQCIASQMQKADASPQAIAFTKQMKGEVYMGQFREMGKVDLAKIVAPTINDPNVEDFILVNGTPRIVYLWENVDKIDLTRDPLYHSLRRQYPNITMWPMHSFMEMQNLAQGGQRFLFDFMLLNGCRGCDIAGSAEIAFDFDAGGQFLGTKLVCLKEPSASGACDAVSVHQAASAAFYGPTPYFSFRDSPFSGTNFSYFYLEDFEDGLLNKPGVTASSGWSVISGNNEVDSVDADDGVIDGKGNSGKSFFSNFVSNSLTFTFNAAALGGNLPTHAGIVWTDANASASHRQVEFSALNSSGTSLGSIGPFELGDDVINGTTAEDRFFGVYNPSGISSITISMPGSNNWEVDHLQYGSVIEKFKPSENPAKCPDPRVWPDGEETPTCVNTPDGPVWKDADKCYSGDSAYNARIKVFADAALGSKRLGTVAVGCLTYPYRGDDYDIGVGGSEDSTIKNKVHAGVDLRGDGNPVFAITSGTVVFRNYKPSLEHSTLIIKTPDGTHKVLYLHMDNVTDKKDIVRGDLIGIVSSVGASHSHLHVEVWPSSSGRYQDKGAIWGCGDARQTKCSDEQIEALTVDPTRSIESPPMPYVEKNQLIPVIPKSNSKAKKDTRAGCNKGSSVLSPSIGGAQGALKKYGAGTDRCAQ